MQYDLAVIGNDEVAFEMLNLAAGAGLRCVALLPQVRHSAWVISQSLRRLIPDLLIDRSTRRQRLFARAARPAMLRSLLTRAIAEQITEHMDMLQTIGVAVVSGESVLQGRLAGSQGLSVDCGGSRIRAAHVAICTGVRRTLLHRSAGPTKFFNPESVLSGRRLPCQAVIVGGGEFGAGLAALMSVFGVKTSLVARAENDSAMLELAAAAEVAVAQHPAEAGLDVSAEPDHSRVVIDCRRSVGYTEHLNLQSIGVEADENGQLWCAGSLETWASGVFGAGAVVGFSPDSTLSPTVQAERILGRILHKMPRPHLYREFAYASV